MIEQILDYYKLGESYPLLLRPDLMNQLPYLKSKFPKHADYAGRRITEIFTKEQLDKATVKKVYTFATTVFFGNKEGAFLQQPLPIEAQFSPVFSIMVQDFDSDGYKDLLLAGNFYGVQPQMGRYDASYGTLLKGNGAGGFTSVPMRHSGLSLNGQIRDIASLTYANKSAAIIFAKNDGAIQVYEITTR